MAVQFGKSFLRTSARFRGERSFRNSTARFQKIYKKEEEDDGLSQHDRTERGPKERFIHGTKFEEWRKRWGDRDNEWKSGFKAWVLDGPVRESSMVKFIQMPFRSWSFSEWDKFFKKRLETRVALSQMFVEERFRVLGHDLNAATFICYRGGAISYVGRNEWITVKPKEEDPINIPKNYVEGLFVEKIDCQKMHNGGIRYEGLENLRGLKGLKWLSFKGNLHFDDWCLDRLASLNLTALEYLDLSETSITYRGLYALTRMNCLNTFRFFIVSNMGSSNDMVYMCALLEEFFPNLLIKIVEVEDKIPTPKTVESSSGNVNKEW